MYMGLFGAFKTMSIIKELRGSRRDYGTCIKITSPRLSPSPVPNNFVTHKQVSGFGTSMVLRGSYKNGHVGVVRLTKYILQIIWPLFFSLARACCLQSKPTLRITRFYIQKKDLDCFSLRRIFRNCYFLYLRLIGSTINKSMNKDLFISNCVELYFFKFEQATEQIDRNVSGKA